MSGSPGWENCDRSSCGITGASAPNRIAMRLLGALCALAASAHAFNSPPRVARAGKTAFAPAARLGAAAAAPLVDLIPLAPRDGAASKGRARIVATATDLPSAVTSKSAADEKLVKYVMERGGRRVRARRRAWLHPRAITVDCARAARARSASGRVAAALAALMRVGQGAARRALPCAAPARAVAPCAVPRPPPRPRAPMSRRRMPAAAPRRRPPRARARHRPPRARGVSRR